MDDGKPIYRRTSVSLKPEIHIIARQLCKETSRSFSNLVEVLVLQEMKHRVLERKEKKEPPILRPRKTKVKRGNKK